MTLPSPPASISLNQVNVELNLAGTTLISLNQASVRTLAGKPTPLSTISMDDLRGKSNRVTVTFNMVSGNVSGITLGTLPGYVAGISDVVVNIPAGVYLISTTDSQTVGALNFYGGAAGDTLTINNSGAIMGKGGNGGYGAGLGSIFSSTAGDPGCPALVFQHNTAVPVQLNNSAYILGGGGGGAGGKDNGGNGTSGGGGGAGGGYGGNAGTSPGSFAQGGNPGLGGNSGDPGGVVGNYYAGAGGGRVAPGSRTTPSTAASVGGSAGGTSGGLGLSAVPQGKYGGGPGEQGQQANIDTSVNSGAGGGGGGWGAAGGSLRSAFNTSEILAGGAAGAAILKNGRTVTLNNSGTIYGAINA